MQPTTEEWARASAVPTASVLPVIEGYEKACAFTARQIATRAIILQGVVAAASAVEPGAIIRWFHEQGIWEQVSNREREFLESPDSMNQSVLNILRWRKEAEWTLLWAIGKVEALGLPTRQCDTRRLVDEIIPALGSDLGPFFGSVELRQPGELLAEDDRHYTLWCNYLNTRRQGEKAVPSDLLVDVLYQRQYAFEWLNGSAEWDDVRCDG
jgi:Domain of unknown function (DUF4272)